MKNSEVRSILQSEILSFKKSEKILTDKEFCEYCNCLLRLCQLDCISVLKQDKIYTATYGDIVDFVTEFIHYTSPFLSRRFKKIYHGAVPNLRTNILFSPRLTEIALGCILRSFFANTHYIEISFFTNISYVGISVSGKNTHLTNNDLTCITKIIHLHGGRCISEFYDNQTRISLAFPISPRFEPIKLVPCKTELCGLCRI